MSHRYARLVCRVHSPYLAPAALPSSWRLQNRLRSHLHASFDSYADVVCAALDGYGDDVIAVGHSLGGLAIPLVAARRPVQHLVYLCAYAPEIGRSLADQLASDPEMVNPTVNPGLGKDELSRVLWVVSHLPRN